jgi:eukaryotic-like serine/threonine-protein kinase
MLITAGTKLGRYEIRSKIGSGGMGRVYLAQDTSELDRMVAIKLLPAEVAADPKHMQRFIREARTVSALNHPNVVTIYEFGQFGATRFIATEFVDGVTLREYLRTQPMSLHDVVDIAMQIAAALDAAHEAHVVHRDIKPDNIMVRRRDQIVKILDFGLAKPVKKKIEGQTGNNADSGTSALHTEPGTVMGTLNYMSPEQAVGAGSLDYRTDIWSLGVVLYEMITGRVPFQGKDLFEQVSAIQEQPHTPLSNFIQRLPQELEDIVARMLAKDPDKRYQTTNELLNDLKELKRTIDVDLRDDQRTALFASMMRPTLGDESIGQGSTGVSGRASAAYPVSSAEYIVNQIKLHKRFALLFLMVFLLGSAVSLFFYLTNRGKTVLTDKDTILLAEIENKTGEDVFEDTLRHGLAVQLQQSPFLDLFSDLRVRATLQLMSLSPDERVTRDRAREICQRQGLKAFITGSIVKFDRNYSITLEALHGQSGEALALVQVEAEGKDQVLKALSRGATELREKLGESLSSIQKFDAKLEVTTSSLEALQQYALGRTEQDRGQSFKAIEFYRHATQLDPDFATAWLGLGLQYANTSQPGLGAESLFKAFALKDRVSENERARITYFYYQIVTGELEKAIEAQEAYTNSYPREARGPGNLGNLYSITGQFEKAVASTSAALQINPNTTIWPGNLAEALIALNRWDQAQDVCERALAQKLDSTSIRERLFAVAFVKGHNQPMQDQLAWASGRQDEYRPIYWQTQTSSFAGQWHKSEEQLTRAIDLAISTGAKEVAASYTADQAVRAAWLGHFPQAVKLADDALKIERNRIVLKSAALAFALAGQPGRAQSLVSELAEQYPKDTLVNQLWLPVIRAALELKTGDAGSALASLEPAKRFEGVGGFWPQTLRSMAHLRLGQPDQAATEARKILDHRGQGPLSLLWPLAHVALAQAAAQKNDTAQARKSYEEFFALWKAADSDLPVLIEAKQHFETLK